MEQRPLRLGDLVDDYCPRERRVTNHAIVAIVNDGIRQTRCTTCDTEHVFKGAKAPRRRKKDDTAELDDANAGGLLVTPEAESAEPPAAVDPPAVEAAPAPAAPVAQAAPVSAPDHAVAMANGNGN